MESKIIPLMKFYSPLAHSKFFIIQRNMKHKFRLKLILTSQAKKYSITKWTYNRTWEGKLAKHKKYIFAQFCYILIDMKNKISKNLMCFYVDNFQSFELGWRTKKLIKSWESKRENKNEVFKFYHFSTKTNRPRGQF